MRYRFSDCELDLETHDKLPHPYREIKGTWRVHLRVVIAGKMVSSSGPALTRRPLLPRACRHLLAS